MSRRIPDRSDNFFIMIFRAASQRRVSIALRIALHSVILVALSLLIYAWVMGMQFKQAMQQQANALGQSLIIQTVSSVTDALVASDTLSLNVLLNNLAKNPLVAHAAVYSVDNRLLSEAGTRVRRHEQGLYTAQITFQETIIGQLRLNLNMSLFHQPMTISLQSMAIISLILLALTLSLSLRLGRQIATPLLQLRAWLRDPDYPAPGSGRQDEIGELAQQLEILLTPEPDPEPERSESFEEEEWPEEDELEPSIEDDDIDPDDPDEERLPEQSAISRTAVLAIQLGGHEQLRRLPRERLMPLLERYRNCLEQAAALYQGELHWLKDGSSLILFHDQPDAEYLVHAICCGELMRALAHALQLDVASAGINLQLRLGLTLGAPLEHLSQAELLLSDSAQQALELSQHSRNLLLLDAEVADNELIRERARIRPVASPAGTSCIERLLDPYPALLERQLGRLQEMPMEG